MLPATIQWGMVRLGRQEVVELEQGQSCRLKHSCPIGNLINKVLLRGLLEGAVRRFHRLDPTVARPSIPIAIQYCCSRIEFQLATSKLGKASRLRSQCV